MQPGFTKLVRADNLAAELGARAVWVKDDSGNPTHSFKDRVVAVALENARRLGFDTIACASTGNLANVSSRDSSMAPRAFCRSASVWRWAMYQWWKGWMKRPRRMVWV